MNQVAKKGDLALLVPWFYVTKAAMRRASGRKCKHNGAVVQVLSDPARQDEPHLWTAPGTVNRILPPCGCNGWAETRFLIPIRDPDADIIRTTEREVMA